MEKLDETERKRRFTIKAFIVKAALIAKKRLLEMVNKIIEKRKISLEKTDGNEKPPVDVIDALIHELGESEETQQHRLPFDFIGGNIIEMMIPGEETVPTAMTLPVKFLTDNPVALAHLVEENMEIKRRKDSSREEYSWNYYMSLTFTQNVISENLRLANIINALWRKALKDVKVKEFIGSLLHGLHAMGCLFSRGILLDKNSGETKLRD
ncbi:3-epi-6-deoxocathasterone 23-monooxygenase CYP90C1-like isoform X2 [Henckelia pumila]|uniref:3-epi-6-deoxocathasterone 23-monooxygenase CYP90C1-like isoform X2 n=1 Tax=Henckelia pumila TaxID=405737 RepID=UPI003C6EA419